MCLPGSILDPVEASAAFTISSAFEARARAFPCCCEMPSACARQHVLVIGILSCHALPMRFGTLVPIVGPFFSDARRSGSS